MPSRSGNRLRKVGFLQPIYWVGLGLLHGNPTGVTRLAQPTTRRIREAGDSASTSTVDLAEITTIPRPRISREIGAKIINRHNLSSATTYGMSCWPTDHCRMTRPPGQHFISPTRSICSGRSSGMRTSTVPSLGPTVLGQAMGIEVVEVGIAEAARRTSRTVAHHGCLTSEVTFGFRTLMHKRIRSLISRYLGIYRT